MTEDIEELRTEKNMILQSLQCEDDSGVPSVKKDIAAMETNLKKLSQQEEKYSDELDSALSQYADLLEQAGDCNLVELVRARKAVRPSMEQEAIRRVQDAYGKNFSPLTLSNSFHEVDRLVNKEDTHSRSKEINQRNILMSQSKEKKNRDSHEH